LICFGGNGRSSGFSAMTRNKQTMLKFVRNVIHLITQYGFDGVDYNWEYPGYEFGRGYGQLVDVEKDYSGLTSLIRETRRQLNLLQAANNLAKRTERYVLTMAYYPDGKQERMLFRGKVHKKVDFFHMMTYDQNGGMHSTYEFTAKAVKLAVEAGLPPGKLTVGLPFYGRHSRTGDWTTYEDILKTYRNSMGSELDLVPAVDPGDESFIGFNNKATIIKKVRLSLQLELAGVMIWEVGQDCRITATIRNGQTHPMTCAQASDSLLYTITNAVEKYIDDGEIEKDLLSNGGVLINADSDEIKKPTDFDNKRPDDDADEL